MAVLIIPKSKSWLAFLSTELWWHKGLTPTAYFYFALVTIKFSELKFQKFCVRILTQKLAELKENVTKNVPSLLDQSG